MLLKEISLLRNRLNYGKARLITLILACFLTLILTAVSYTTANTATTANDDFDEDNAAPVAPLADSGPTNLLYVESNDPQGNAILMYGRNSDGSISKDPIATFPTNGKGYGNPKAIIGPQDGDHPLIVSPDKKFMFAVNMGSNDISVFNINSDGTLKLVDGSPFPSGGQNPVSLAYAKNKKAGTLLLVANKACSQDSAAGPSPSGEPPNYTSFSVSATGQLTQIANSTIKVNVGANPAEVLATANGKVAFGNDLWAAPSTTPVPAPFRPFIPQTVSYLRSFTIAKTGQLKQLSSSPALPPNPNVDSPFLLGMVLHPTQPIIYIALVARNELAVYQYDSKGNVTFVRSVPSQGVGICWAVINKNATFLYTTNTFDGTIESFDLKDPLNPAKKVALLLRDPGPPTPQQFPPFSSQPYQLALDPTDQYLYFVGQRSTTDPDFPGGNNLHVYKLNSDGTMSEPFSPVNTPLAKNAAQLGVFIQGVVVF